MSRAKRKNQADRRRWWLPILLAVVILVLDQLSKDWIMRTLGPELGERQIALIGDWVSLVYWQNTGVAFGLFQNVSQIFILTSLLISAGAIYAYIVYLPNRSPWVQIGIGLVVGGALGNVIDRVQHGFVVDFIKVGWWPVFNIADSTVTVGVVMLALYLLFMEDDPPKREYPRDDALLGMLLEQELGPGSTEASSPSERS